jgi:hypothetical protein
MAVWLEGATGDVCASEAATEVVSTGFKLPRGMATSSSFMLIVTSAPTGAKSNCSKPVNQSTSQPGMLYMPTSAYKHAEGALGQLLMLDSQLNSCTRSTSLEVSSHLCHVLKLVSMIFKWLDSRDILAGGIVGLGSNLKGEGLILILGVARGSNRELEECDDMNALKTGRTCMHKARAT